MKFVDSIEKLVYQFGKLPGVGHKTAQRYALAVLNMTDEQANQLVEAISSAKKNVVMCSVCGNLTDGDPCNICASRKGKTICVVKEVKDIMAIERLGEYNGTYHVLGGLIDPLHGVNVSDIRLAELFRRLAGDVDEIILALDTTTEGEATSTYIARTVKQYGVKVTRLAQGISIGSELQYADEVTLSRALNNREQL